MFSVGASGRRRLPPVWPGPHWCVCCVRVIHEQLLTVRYVGVRPPRFDLSLLPGRALDGRSKALNVPLTGGTRRGSDGAARVDAFCGDGGRHERPPESGPRRYRACVAELRERLPWIMQARSGECDGLVLPHSELRRSLHRGGDGCGDDMRCLQLRDRRRLDVLEPDVCSAPCGPGVSGLSCRRSKRISRLLPHGVRGGRQRVQLHDALLPAAPLPGAVPRHVQRRAGARRRAHLWARLRPAPAAAAGRRRRGVLVVEARRRVRRLRCGRICRR